MRQKTKVCLVPAAKHLFFLVEKLLDAPSSCHLVGALSQRPASHAEGCAEETSLSGPFEMIFKHPNLDACLEDCPLPNDGEA
jgi:hypothetical protein